MTVQMSLLDFLAFRSNCVCLSDLRFLDSGDAARLRRTVARIPFDQPSLKEWNDCLAYLTGAPPCAGRAEAKDRLLCLLLRPWDASER